MFYNNSIIFKRIPAIKLIFLISIIFIINSCIKEDFKVSKFDVKNFTPGLAIPIVNAKLDMNDLTIDSSSGWDLKQDASNFMTLVYYKTESFIADSFLKVSNQLLNNNYSFSLDNSVPIGGSRSTPYNSYLEFTSPDNDLFDLMDIKSGTLKLSITSIPNLNMRGNIVFRLPYVKKGGNMLSFTVFNRGKPYDTTIDLSGYSITFSHLGNINRISTECIVTGYNDGQPNLSPYSINLKVSLESIKFSKAFGFFSSRSFNFANQIIIDLFDGIKVGVSYFENPKLKLNLINSVGIPVNLNILSFAAHSDIKAPFDKEITGLPNPIKVTSPTVPGKSVNMSYLLDKSNSNIKDAINMVPSKFKYDVIGLTAPDGVTQNFIFDTSKVKMEVEVELPLWGRIKDYTVEDTFPFTLDNLENFESITFNLLLANGFPLESTVQLYFLDKNHNTLDSLFEFPQDYLKSAITDPITGLVTKPVSHLYKIFFNRKRLDMITNCTTMKIKAYLHSTIVNSVQKSVKIYSYYNFDVKFSALAKLKN